MHDICFIRHALYIIFGRDRRTSMNPKISGAEIARLARVSQSTVSRALNPHRAWQISAEKRAEILSLCQTHGYPVKNGIKPRYRTFKIGFVMGRMDHDLDTCRFMLRQLCDHLQASGYTLTLIRVDFSSPKMILHVRHIIKSDIADLYIVGSSLLNGQTIELFHRISRRVICYYTGSDIWKPARFHSLISSIRYDHETSFRQATEQIPLPLLRDSFFFGYCDRDAEEKLHLLRRQLRKHHISLTRSRVVLYGSGLISSGLATYRDGVRAVHENLERIRDHRLYWVESTPAAAALKDELERTGSTCGSDYQIVTYRFYSSLRQDYSRIDDDFCHLVCDEDQFARTLSELILTLIDDPTPRHLVIPTRFEISDSLAAQLKAHNGKV